MTPVLAISGGVVAAIVIVLVIDVFAIMFGLSFMRARRAERAERAAPGLPGVEEPAKGPKPVSRREFFRRSLVTSYTLFWVQFGAGTIAFLWPNLKGGFGSVINAGRLQDITAEINTTKQPFYVGSGRFYVIRYTGKAAGDVDYESERVAAQGVMPLYQRCVHLGCRVPFCQTSQWFECPCHGSKYNGAGEYQLGPAPRGMDRFRVEVDGAGNVMVDTSQVILGPPRGTDTVSQPPQGSFCVAAG